MGIRSVVVRRSSFVAVLLALCVAARAQQGPDLGERVRQLKAVTPKAVLLVFDISGSMEKYDMLSRGRESTIRLVEDGLKPGDTFVVYTFDTATRKAAEHKIGADGGQGAIEEVPGELSHKPGTNIRWPHHEALRWVEQHHPRKTFLIIVSDSYNDPPAPDDPALGKYRAYYRPNSLTVYPDSPENRDYERLLKRRNALGITTWGVGVEINKSTGRPIERYLAPTPTEGAPVTPAPSAPAAPPPSSGSRAWLWIPLVVIALAVIGFLWSRGSQPITVSLSDSRRSFRNYRLGPGSAISLGGAGASEYDLGYPVAGTTHPVATLRRVGKGFRLEPASAVDGAATVVLNQEPLKAPAPISPGDEIKIRLPAADPAAPPRELRLEFGRGRDEEL